MFMQGQEEVRQEQEEEKGQMIGANSGSIEKGKDIAPSEKPKTKDDVRNSKPVSHRKQQQFARKGR